MTDNSPLPWVASFENCGGGITIIDRTGRRIAHTAEFHDKSKTTLQSPEAIANAEMIVKAVNNHDALRDTLQQCLDLLDNSDVRHYIGTALGEMSPLHKALRESKKVLRETME